MSEILVLGSRGSSIFKFLDSFRNYLQYDTYDEALIWERSNYYDEKNEVVISFTAKHENNKINFLYTPKTRQLSAIIFLVKLSEKFDELILKYKKLLAKFKQFTDKNILYIFMGNEQQGTKKTYMDAFELEENGRNIFCYEEDTFYKICRKTWQQGVDFCKNIYKYIAGLEVLTAEEDKTAINERNIFVLDTYNSRFAHLLGNYLNEITDETDYIDYYKETEGVTISKKLIRNQSFNFITTNLKSPHTSDSITSILLNFERKQQITAIIFPIKIDTKVLSEVEVLRDKYVLIYKKMLAQIKQLTAKNILYIFIYDTERTIDEQAKQKYINTLEINQNSNNIFYFKLEENWQENCTTFNSIFNYIGNKSTDGLQNFYVTSRTTKTVLKLADDLMEMFILVYICCKYSKLASDDKYCYDFDLKNYKTKITSCYGNNCFQWKNHPRNQNVRMKLPKICHDPSECGTIDGSTLFQTPDGTCSQCNCTIDSHSKNYFDYIVSCRYYNNEMRIAINILATFLIYKNQNQETYNIENTIIKILNLQDSMHQAVYEHFKKDLGEEVAMLKNKSNTITSESVILTLRELNFKEIDKLIPNYIDDVFPNDFLVAQFVQEQSEANKEINPLQMELQELKDYVEEMKRKLNQVLRLIDNNPTEENANNLNSSTSND